MERNVTTNSERTLEQCDLFTDLQAWEQSRYMVQDPPSPVDRAIRRQEMKELYYVLCRIVTVMLDPGYVPRATQRRFKPRSTVDPRMDPQMR